MPSSVNCPLVSGAASALFLCMSVLAAGSAIAQGYDPVVFSFATVGDSRQDPAKADPTTFLAGSPGAPSLTGTLLPQDAEYLQNSAAANAILAGIQSQGPNMLFFNGDMIYGYGRPTLPTNGSWSTGTPITWTGAETVNADTIFEYQQYAYWRGSVSSLFNSGTYVMPVPGNHESQCNSTSAPYTSTTNANRITPCASGKTAYADNENAYRNNTSDLVQDLVTNTRFQNVTGFTASNVNITTPPVASTNNGPITGVQTDLTFSFDIQATATLLLHFVVINTDPSGADGTAPADWLATDLAAAQTRGANEGSSVKVKYFVFGHKPAFTYDYNNHGGNGVNATPYNDDPSSSVAFSGLDANTTSANANQALRNAFWKVIAQYGATYFSGHEHVPNVQQFADQTGTYTNKPYQVIVGSGGSPFDDVMAGGTCAGVSASDSSCTEPVFNSPFDRYYAWALVQIHQSGNVSLNMTGFADQSYYLLPTGGFAGFGPPQDLAAYDVSSLQ
jgi:Calcineurin-like phosphoesterase